MRVRLSPGAPRIVSVVTEKKFSKSSHFLLTDVGEMLNEVRLRQKAAALCRGMVAIIFDGGRAFVGSNPTADTIQEVQAEGFSII